MWIGISLQEGLGFNLSKETQREDREKHATFSSLNGAVIFTQPALCGE